MTNQKGKGKKRITLMMHSEDYQLLKKKTKEKGMSIATFVRMIILKEIKEV